MTTIYYAEATPDQTTNSSSFTEIEGLGIQLPAASAEGNFALLTLNLTQPYAVGGSPNNGISYQITFNGNELATGAFTSERSQNGRSPFTMTALIDLADDSETFVQANWAAVAGGTANLGGGASLSAVLCFVSGFSGTAPR